MITANIPSSFKPTKVLRASIAIALGLTLTMTSSWASTLGRTAIQTQLDKLAQQGVIPANTTITLAKSYDLNLAVSMAIEEELATPTALTTTEIAVSALDPIGNKVRGDRSTLAAQLVATAASADPGLAAADYGDLVGKIYASNSLVANQALSPVGKAAVLAQGIVSAASTAHASAIGSDDDIVATNLDYTSLMVSVLNQKALKSAKLKDRPSNENNDQIQAFADGLFVSKIVGTTNRQSFAIAVAQKTAAANQAGAAAVLGAFVAEEISGDSALTTFATNTILPDPKLQKALGDILARTMVAHSNKTTLATSLIGSIVTGGVPKASYNLVTQGILRAGNAGDVNGVLGVLLPVAQSDFKRLNTFAGVVSTRTGGDQAKLVNIVSNIVSGQTAENKATLGSTIISASGLDNPESAGAAIGAVIDSNSGVSFSNSAVRTGLAQFVAAKVTSYSAVGYLVGEVINRNIAQDGYNAGNIANQVTSIMLKKTAAANDIAYRVAALSGVGTDKAAFAVTLAVSDKKFVQAAAVGASLADPQDAGDITAAVVTYNPAGDTKTLGQAAVIAGAVGNAVDAEAAADIGAKIAAKMATVATALRPIKITLVNALAGNLAKAIQNKPGVNTTNRVDELGELGAAIVGQILGQYGNDAKKLGTALTGVGNAILTTLKIKKLNMLTPKYDAKTQLETQMTDPRTQVAGYEAAEEVVGSIFQTIWESSLPQATKNYLLGVTTITGATNPTGVGPLEKSFLGKSGKKGSITYTAVQTAVDTVLAGNGDGLYEVGADYDPITDNTNG